MQHIEKYCRQPTIINKLCSCDERGYRPYFDQSEYFCRNKDCCNDKMLTFPVKLFEQYEYWCLGNHYLGFAVRTAYFCGTKSVVPLPSHTKRILTFDEEIEAFEFDRICSIRIHDDYQNPKKFKVIKLGAYYCAKDVLNLFLQAQHRWDTIHEVFVNFVIPALRGNTMRLAQGFDRGLALTSLVLLNQGIVVGEIIDGVAQSPMTTLSGLFLDLYYDFVS